MTPDLRGFGTAADTMTKALGLGEWEKHALALYWHRRMMEQGGPDGSDLDEAIEQDAEGAMAAISAHLDTGLPDW